MSKVLLGVCGGIAAYKAAELLRALQREDHEVRVVVTRAAEEFVRPLTFSSLSGHAVYGSLWSDEQAASGLIEHIEQAQWTDVLVVAPATANTMAKFAHGLADDFLSAAYLATTAPVVLAPAMNVNMWEHAATRANVEALQKRGHTLVEPDAGYLACGMIGSGRFPEIEEIVCAVERSLHRKGDLAGETILVTAGGTREAIDAVRFLGNRSSGKMGYALAAGAQRRGARVILVSAPTALPVPAGCEFIAVATASEMREAVLQRLPEATMVIKAAAVADFRMREPAKGKMERSGALTLELEPTEDIVRSVVERRRAGTLVIAFAAEAGDGLERARSKLLRKGADAIVVNDISRSEIGFDAEHNEVVFLTTAQATALPKASKVQVAERILDEAIHLRESMVLV